MSKLREEMTREMELKGLSVNTQKAYLRCVANYAKHYGKSPDRLGTLDVKAYLHFLLCTEKCSHSNVNTNYSALKFFYEATLRRKWDIKYIPRTKTSKTLPVVLATTEVEALLDSLTNIKHKTILMTIYAAGLRVSEAACLKVSDIE